MLVSMHKTVLCHKTEDHNRNLHCYVGLLPDTYFYCASMISGQMLHIIVILVNHASEKVKLDTAYQLNLIITNTVAKVWS